MLFEYEEDDVSTLMWCQGKVVDFIRESKDKHVFVKIEWSDKCVRVGNWDWDSSLGGDAWPILSVFLDAGSPLDLCNLILTLVILQPRFTDHPLADSFLDTVMRVSEN